MKRVLAIISAILLFSLPLSANALNLNPIHWKGLDKQNQQEVQSAQLTAAQAEKEARKAEKKAIKAAKKEQAKANRAAAKAARAEKKAAKKAKKLSKAEMKRRAAVTEETLKSLKLNDLALISADTDFQATFINLVSLLSKQEQTVAIRSQIADIMMNSKLSETKKCAALNDLMAAYAIALENNKSSAINVITNLSAAEQKNLVNTLNTMSQDADRYIEVATKYAKYGTTLAQNASDTTILANNISDIRKTAVTLSNSAKNIKVVATQVAAYARIAGLIF